MMCPREEAPISNPYPAPFRILVISLASDSARRKMLEQQFGAQYEQFQFINAIDMRNGRTAPDTDPPGLRHGKLRRRLTRQETGCALSHLDALHNFIASDAGHCLILEDDIIGTPKDIAAVKEHAGHLPATAIMICGGQEGLRNRHYLYGSPTVFAGVWQVPPISRRFMSRACCYLVTRAAARWLLEKQESRLDRADQWDELLDGYEAVYFSALFSHPTDLGTSHIEAGRRTFTDAGALKRIWLDGILHTMWVNVVKVCMPALARLRGYKPVSVSEK